MSGITPLIDTLLATRLAQRVDLVPLRAALEIASPDAVASAGKVTNDIRLPSRSALQQLLGVALRDGGGSHKSSNAPAAARPDASVTLSTVARVLSAILELPASPEAKILGTKPLWPDSQPPSAPVLTATLARTVATSGLFYESHLMQFAAGTRTLAQLAQEPQAQLDVTVKIAPALPGAGVAGQNPGPGGASGAASAQDQAGQEFVANRSDANAPDALRGNTSASAGVHPDAMALVRQQLELLAVPVFRWGGEVWPGTPMDWEIQQEPDQRPTAAADEATQRSWSTRLALSLPRLKDVEVRLSLFGNTLQLHLAASENATLALLGNERKQLPGRFADLGLQLGGVWIGALAPAPAVSAGRKADDAV